MTDTTRFISDAKLSRLTARARRKPRIALMGEANSGRSTVANLLLGQPLLPVSVTASQSPPILVSYGESAAHWVDQDGAQHPIALADLASVPASALHLHVFTPAPLLRDCDLIESPGLSNPAGGPDLWRSAAAFSNLILWCSPAPRAWRASERQAWLSLPKRFHARSLLVMTGTDLLAEKDLAEVTHRVRRATEGLFGALIPLARPVTAGGGPHRAMVGSEARTASGAAALEDAVRQALRDISDERKTLLSRYVSAGPSQPDARVTYDAGGSGFGATALVALPDNDGGRSLLAREPDEPAQVRPVPAPPEVEAQAPTPIRSLEDLIAHPDPAWISVREEPADHSHEAEAFGNPPGLPDEYAIRPAPGPAPGDLPADVGEPALPTPSVPAEPVPVPAAVAEDLPQAVRIWREVVGRRSGGISDTVLASMIEELLFGLSQSDDPSRPSDAAVGRSDPDRSA
ncbi:hypothetical protein [Rubellimicrobium arenae]|uniref:hypothetical protein n=1 Tax=Rubellimicrobium arenae TaxID=2817372 RepID=UPI001B308163|nr:hypothetical protein [Rubellimicrobium arenae]